MKSHEVVSTEGTLGMDFLVSVVRFRSDSERRREGLLNQWLLKLIQ